MYNSAQASGVSFDASEILVRFLKYIFEGLMVAVAAYFIPNTKLPPKDLMMISLVGAATFAVLDLFAPAVGSILDRCQPGRLPRRRRHALVRCLK